MKLNTEYTSFFKREPRTNSTLPIHRISKAINENNHGEETEGNVHVSSFFQREPQTNSTLHIHRISKAISENNHGGETEGNVHVFLVLSA